MNRYGKLYASLLRLYPETFRNRFADSMQQTFHDVCRDQRTAGRGLFAVMPGLFADTFVGILRERSALAMPHRRNINRLMLITTSLLAVPLLGMQLSKEVDWSLVDFVAAGLLIFGAGLTFELIVRRSGDAAYRLATGLACAVTLLLIWINLAVGLVVSEGDPSSLLYLGVLVVGLVGASSARLRPQGMARTLFAMSIAHAAVTAVAIVAWKPVVSDGDNIAGLASVLALNAVFVLLFAASAALFRRAGKIQHKPS